MESTLALKMVISSEISQIWNETKIRDLKDKHFLLLQTNLFKFIRFKKYIQQ